jgi:hypothetical protein
LPLEILFLLLKGRFVILNLGYGHVDLGLKVGRIDLEKQISLAQLLVVSDRHVNNRTRYPRGDPNNVCSDLAISGPGMLDVPAIERDSGPNREANHDQRI